MISDGAEQDINNTSRVLFDIYDGPEDFDQQEHI